MNKNSKRIIADNLFSAVQNIMFSVFLIIFAEYLELSGIPKAICYIIATIILIASTQFFRKIDEDLEKIGIKQNFWSYVGSTLFVFYLLMISTLIKDFFVEWGQFYFFIWKAVTGIIWFIICLMVLATIRELINQVLLKNENKENKESD